MSTHAPSRSPFRFKLGLRALMLLILAFGLWMSGQVNAARRQHRAVAAIKEYGGFVHYDHEFVGGNVIPGREPRGPRWLRERIGDDFFRTVTYVNLCFEGGGKGQLLTERKDPTILPAIGELPEITYLLLQEGQATDASLTSIRGLGKLKELNIVRAEQLTDAGMAHLAGLKSLEKLSLDGAKITDAGLTNLNDLRRLKDLYIWSHYGAISDADLADNPQAGDDSAPEDLNRAITDAGLAHLSRLTGLEGLTIYNGDFTDAGLDSLRGMVHLKELHLPFGRYRFTAEGMASLEGFKNLAVLDLQGEKIPGMGLDHLATLPKLTQLWLALNSPLIDHDQDVREGVERLLKRKPGLSVR